MRVAIGSDHAGFDLKEDIKRLLDELKVNCADVGPATGEPVDYPDIAELVSRAVVDGRADRGVLICGTGIGMAIAANKIAGVRAAVLWNVESARLSRAHNDANIMTMGGRTTPVDRARDIVRTFLVTDYEGGRHDRRLEKIARLECRDS